MTGRRSEDGSVDLLALHLDAVGGAEVDHLDDVGDQQPRVAARHLRVAQLDLAAPTTTEVCRAGTERALLPGRCPVRATMTAGAHGLAPVGISLGAAGDGDWAPERSPALGDRGARVDGAVALGHVGQREVTEPRLRVRATGATGLGEDEVLGQLPDGGGAVDGGDEVGVDVAGGTQGELQLHGVAVLRVRVANEGSVRRPSPGVSGPRAKSGRGSMSERSRRQKSQLGRSPRASLVDLQ